MSRRRNTHDRANRPKIALSRAAQGTEAAAFTPRAAKTPEEIRLDLVADVERLLRWIRGLAGEPLDERVDERAGTGFVTPAARIAQGQQYQSDKAAMQARLAAGQPVGRGQTAAPGNLAAISASAELWAVLMHWVRAFRRVLPPEQRELRVIWGSLDDPTQRPDTRDLATHLLDLVPHILRTTLLEALKRDLERIHDNADRAVNGTAVELHPDPCPWCGRRTLLVNYREDLITCDRDSADGKHHPCVCPDPLCACKSRPIGFRHSWHRTRWYRLSDLISLANTKKEPNP